MALFMAAVVRWRYTQRQSSDGAIHGGSAQTDGAMQLQQSNQRYAGRGQRSQGRRRYDAHVDRHDSILSPRCNRD